MFTHFYAISHGKGQFAYYSNGEYSSDNKEKVFINLAARSSLIMNSLSEAEHTLERCQSLRPDINFVIKTYET